ncbi:hypothetical protein CDL12_26580 [Handroanthus impetiginosus]|uniref:TFIIS central domain-containing protein n=1 Tax=Handroanthus impetiginosus TaxID=429701 RepID=A0A2G9G7I8_9LAMI|nr:hypothetical protein CDL12_26580 [Handroanthus impetiginosus]
MSNNLISEYLFSDMQVVQMEHGSNSLDLPVSEMHMKMVGQVSSNADSHPFYVSTGQMGLVEPRSSNPGFNSLKISSGGTMGLSSVWTTDQLRREDASVMINLAGEKTSYPAKRKADVGPLSNNSSTQRSPLANKRPAHVGADANSVGFLQPSAPQKKTATAQSKLGSPRTPAQSSLNKKMVRNDSISGKSGLQRGQTAKRQTAQIESASKVRSESSDAVRSKMRESLAAALALASQKQDDVSNTEKNQNEAAITLQHMNSQASESNLTVGGNISGSGEVFHSKELAATGKKNDSSVFPAELPSSESSGNRGQAFQQFQYSLPDEDVSFGDNFFVKDDLLQGNGLSWAFDFDVHMGEGKEAQHVEKPKSVEGGAQENGGLVAILTQEDVAFKIEAELFKLFGGVNKKYREKGRSLLFNLKDRNNPELRERVMSGEISPERLCSMSAEELASKELSQWRMAKAEELAQMVVLPDNEVDIRRLVRKTHKGEFQVEVEHDDGIAAEVSGGTSVSTKPQPKKETEPHSPSKAIKEKAPGQESNSGDQDLSGSLIIPADGSDLMQGMMVEELKDAEFLPPIVSLDEFMESLNSEPPFENLSADAAQKTPVSQGESPKPVSSSRVSNRAPSSPKDAFSKKSGIVKEHEVDVKKSSVGSVKQRDLPSIVPKVEYVWDGILQLNISSSVTVGGLFQSGEKTSTKEWPTSLEIKGRVRLDAFEKFVQELPNSRTRAVMVYKGLLFFLVNNFCLLFYQHLAFCLQTRQRGFPYAMVNGVNLCPLILCMYNCSVVIENIEKSDFLPVKCFCYNLRSPKFHSENDILIFFKIRCKQ